MLNGSGDRGMSSKRDMEVPELVFQPLNISWPYGRFFSPEAVLLGPVIGSL